MTDYEYPPGSDEAIERGCKCPTTDNAHGKGWGLDGERYWVSVNCPLHGDAINDDSHDT